VCGTKVPGQELQRFAALVDVLGVDVLGVDAGSVGTATVRLVIVFYPRACRRVAGVSGRSQEVRGERGRSRRRDGAALLGVWLREP
jgi:hypothetical protein